MTARIAFAGMSHLGINHLAAAADRGYAVLGFDLDASRIQDLRNGFPVVAEPGLQDILARCAPRIEFSSEPSALSPCDLVYISLDVPTDAEGRSRYDALQGLIAIAGEHIPPAVPLIVLSQVPPGFMRTIARPASALYYQVETLIFGRAVERALHPERFIIGCGNPDSPLPGGLREYLASFGCPVLCMCYESAELAKIAINMFLVSTVATTNMLAETCEAIGARWSEIAPALRLDRRIGEYAYLSPGLGISGGNLERDIATLRSMASAHGVDDGVVRAWQAGSRHHRDWVLRHLRTHLSPGATIAIWGLTYKADTDSVKNSPALELIRGLRGWRLRAYDPAARYAAEPGIDLERVDDPLDACDGADALAIMTPWDAFGRAEPAAIASRLAGNLVVDPFGVLAADHCRRAGIRHFVIGESAPRP